MGKYNYPLPQKFLIDRYGSFLDAAVKCKPATLVALPHTGRTSMLRFLLSDNANLLKIGVNTNGVKLYLIDPDKAGPTFLGYLKEIYRAITNSNAPLYMDDYDLSRAIFEKLSTGYHSLILTLNNLTTTYTSDLDRFAVMLKKDNKNVNVLWSVDCLSWKKYEAIHSSSSFFSNIIFYKSFNEEETFHSIKRHMLAKGRKLSRNQSSKLFALTGGISGLFHPYVDTNGNVHLSQVSKRIIENISNSLELLTDQEKQKLLTKSALSVIYDLSTKEFINIDDIGFTSYPTSQEINIVRLLKAKSSLPVSRDEIALAIWGKQWESKYSDWAIDKAISRLKQKMTSGHRIMAVRKGGYRLEEIK